MYFRGQDESQIPLFDKYARGNYVYEVYVRVLD